VLDVLARQEDDQKQSGHAGDALAFAALGTLVVVLAALGRRTGRSSGDVLEPRGFALEKFGGVAYRF
jgi:hypothetical protein